MLSRIQTLLSVAGVALTLSACSVDSGPKNGEKSPAGAPTEQGEAAEYSFAMPEDLKDGETAYVTMNDRVFECTKANSVDGSRRVQCKSSGNESGLSLHTNK